MKNKRNKIINSFAISATVAIVFIAFVTIFGELHGPFKDWLKGTFNHHWIGKGVIAIAIFYAFGFFGYFNASDRDEIMTRMLKIIFWITLIGIFVITGFFLYEYRGMLNK